MSRATLLAIAAALSACAPSVTPPARTAGPTVPGPAPAAQVAVAPFVAPATPDAPFRASAPPLAPAAELAAPAIHSFHLANGIPVLLLEQHALGLVRVEALLHTKPAPPGANLMAAHDLWLGTSALTQAQLQAANDAEITDMTPSYSWGWIRLPMTTTSDHVASMVGRLSNVFLTPSFPADQVVRITREVARETEVSDDAPRAIAVRALRMALYGVSVLGDDSNDERSAEIGALRRNDIASAYDAALDPSSAALLVIGDTTEKAIRPLLEKQLGAWHGRAHPKGAAPKKATRLVVSMSSPRIVVVDHPGPTSLVMFGGEGPAYASLDWGATLALRTILNGSKGRAANALKDAAPVGGLATLNLWAAPDAPRATLTASFPTAQTARALADLDRLMRAAKTAEITPEQLDDARLPLAAEEPFWRASLGGETDLMEGLVVQKLSPDDVPKRAARLRAVTADDVRRAAASYLDPDRMKVVIVGEWSKLRPQLVDLGWGPVEVRDATGAVVVGAGAQ